MKPGAVHTVLNRRPVGILTRERDVAPLSSSALQRKRVTLPREIRELVPIW
jgi:hypothetical protein